ncbi:E3 ubiquitin-protein ligase TRIM71-like [Orbicella faveolata]|uniref:E3 ubiquitin-protein ligase TRIM71-like n=1 Tax=Orbicella faveolata TaxID=48498 RepID=UPI0009E37FCC|nr:E3 ubiquitin-protein ligase TRIM71-like [Orbicella faveolata]
MKTSNQADLKDQVEVLIEPAKDVTNAIVSEKEDGNLQVKFTPIVPGAYSIEVKINGDKLPTCLFNIQVKERELVVVSNLDLKFFQGDELQGLFGIAINMEGNIVVTDNHGHCVYVFDKEGNCLRKIGGLGKNSGQFKYPDGVSFLNDNEILIADYDNHRIQHSNIKTGNVVKTFGKRSAGKRKFENPIDVCSDDEGRIVVAEFSNNRIQVISKEGRTHSIFGGSGPEKLNHPVGCIPFKNMIFVSDRDNNCVKAFDQ